MEKKLLRKILISFITAGIALIGIFSVLLYRHEENAQEQDVNLLLNQFEAVYNKSEERMWKKRAMYASDYYNRGWAIDFFLGKAPQMQTTEGLQELVCLMDVKSIYLLDEKGSIILGSTEEAAGRGLLENEDGNLVREVVEDTEWNANRMVLESGQVFEGIPAQDFVVVKSVQDGYEAIFVGINESIAKGVKEAVAIENVMGSIPVMKDQAFLVIDPETREILGTTWLKGGETHIDESAMKLFQGAVEGKVVWVYGDYKFIESRMFHDMLLVSIHEHGTCVRIVAIQVFSCAAILSIMFLLMVIIIRRYFRQYVINEFSVIENTLQDLIAGKEGVRFYTNHDTEMKQIVKALNKVTSINEGLKLAAGESDKDSLTGLVNRSGFEKYIGAFMEGQNRKGVIIMMDVDNFKTINDTMGHPEGDRVLQMVASCLKKEFREDDMVVRLGGDEFVVFLQSDIPKERLAAKLEEMMGHIWKERDYNNQTYRVSISVGAVFLTPEVSNYEELYQCVDDALYQAKQMGKNRYVIHICGTEHTLRAESGGGGNRGRGIRWYRL